jgi:hypothetical protein
MNKSNDAVPLTEKEIKKLKRMRMASVRIGREVTADCRRLEVNLKQQKKCPERIL